MAITLPYKIPAFYSITDNVFFMNENIRNLHWVKDSHIHNNKFFFFISNSSWVQNPYSAWGQFQSRLDLSTGIQIHLLYSTVRGILIDFNLEYNLTILTAAIALTIQLNLTKNAEFQKFAWFAGFVYFAMVIKNLPISILCLPRKQCWALGHF